MKPFKDLVTGFVRQWNFTRSESLEILESLSDEELNFKPKGEKWQSIAYQFGCIARTQMVYTRAIREGKMDYSWFRGLSLPSEDDLKDKKALMDLLLKADKEWVESIRAKLGDGEFLISWPGFKFNLMNHITGLISHERIHHGELISYLTIAGIDFPKNFKNNWAL